MGLQSLREKHCEGKKNAIINGVLHKLACRWHVWRRLAHIALYREYDEPIFITEGTAPKKALTALYGESVGVRVMSPIAYCKEVTVKQPRLVICPVRPTNLNQEIVDALLQAKELHIIRSYDHAQERFFEELRRGAAKRRSQVKEVWYCDAQ